MARQKRKSIVLTNAQKRAASLASISPSLNLENGLTLVAFNQAIAQTQAKLDAYNTLLSSVDSAVDSLEADEKELAVLSNRMLMGVASKYGKDSNEYEMAGGVRMSERKKPIRTAKTKA